MKLFSPKNIKPTRPPTPRPSWFFWKEKNRWFVSKVRRNIMQLTCMHVRINWSWCMTLRILFWKMDFSLFTHWSEQPLAENKSCCWRLLKAEDRGTVLKRELYQSLTFAFLKVSSRQINILLGDIKTQSESACVWFQIWVAGRRCDGVTTVYLILNIAFVYRDCRIPGSSGPGCAADHLWNVPLSLVMSLSLHSSPFT